MAPARLLILAFQQPFGCRRAVKTQLFPHFRFQGNHPIKGLMGHMPHNDTSLALLNYLAERSISFSEMDEK